MFFYLCLQEGFCQQEDQPFPQKPNQSNMNFNLVVAVAIVMESFHALS